jgi:tRNA modification GTPase
MHGDTIFALASAPGRAGIAVVRVSGDQVRAALQALGCVVPAPRKAQRAAFKDPTSAEVIDNGLLLYFPAPHSFTGEDVAELHIHGGRAVIDGILAALSSISGLRPAEPGEFTRRAFENDKLDLTEAEALADLVDAETRAQARQALRQMGGALKELYDDWRHRLVQALAHLEAVIDFPDEDLPPEVANKLWGEVGDLTKAIAAHLNDGRRGERVREGLAIAIIGPPNAGKSSLINMLARREAAIVSPLPGTTRDVIEVQLDLDGYAVTVADTAGLREAADIVEDEGIRRARARANQADLKIAVFDGATFPSLDAATLALGDSQTIALVNKADLCPESAPRQSGLLFMSLKTGAGVDGFLARLHEKVRALSDTGAAMPLTRARHRKALQECVEALERARAATLPELAAEDLRLAARALGRLTGRVDVEEILDAIFRDFCIGK